MVWLVREIPLNQLLLKGKEFKSALRKIGLARLSLLVVPIQNLTSSHKYNSVVPFDVLKDLVVIFDTVGCSGNVRMSGNTHYARALFTLSIQGVKVVPSPLKQFRRPMMLHHVHRDVI